mmetsp:Transcript_54503/g.158341  ORF Transcript_54503/g.158341 Transcript_54503/m.158341 type:complete len:155 (+) Transcript_54503:60-524(+)
MPAAPSRISTSAIASALPAWVLRGCGGKRPHAATPSHNPENSSKATDGLRKVAATRVLPPRNPMVVDAGRGDTRKVHIDRETEVPLELYMLMLEAGKNARSRGQHHKVRPRKCTPGGGTSGVKTRLVSSSPCSEPAPAAAPANQAATSMRLPAA